MNVRPGDTTRADQNRKSHLRQYLARLESNIADAQSTADVRALIDDHDHGRISDLGEAIRSTAQHLRDRAFGADVFIAYDLLAISYANECPPGVGYYFRRAVEYGLHMKPTEGRQHESPSPQDI